jgi:hypothetical protein
VLFRTNVNIAVPDYGRGEEYGGVWQKLYSQISVPMYKVTTFGVIIGPKACYRTPALAKVVVVFVRDCTGPRAKIVGVTTERVVIKGEVKLQVGSLQAHKGPFDETIEIGSIDSYETWGGGEITDTEYIQMDNSPFTNPASLVMPLWQSRLFMIGTLPGGPSPRFPGTF